MLQGCGQSFASARKGLALRRRCTARLTRPHARDDEPVIPPVQPTVIPPVSAIPATNPTPSNAKPEPTPSPAAPTSTTPAGPAGTVSVDPDDTHHVPSAGTAKAGTSKNVFSHALNENFATEELVEELKDKDSFGTRGEAVLVAQLVVIGLVIFPPMQLQGLVYLGGVLSLVAGAVATLYSSICLGTSFSPLVTPRKNNALKTTGMYQYMRHPLYSGLILMAFGLAAVSYSESRLVLAFLLMLVLNYKAKKEEEAMAGKHGREYAEYRDRVPRFFPLL